MINYILSGDRLTVILPNRMPISVPREQKERIKKILDLINNNDLNLLENELFPAKKIPSISNNQIIFDGTHVKWIGSDIPMPKVLAERILDFDSNGYPIKSLINFWINLLQNPSKTTQEELYGFIEHGSMAITDDGHIIAYKKVTSKNGNPVPKELFGWYIDSNNLVRYANGQIADQEDRRRFLDYVNEAKMLLFDSWTGTFDNSIGAKPHINREDVDPNRNRTCSIGLHVASYNYAQTYTGDVLIQVKVNPKDFVAVPVDYNNEKARVTDYEVIGFGEPIEPKTKLYSPGFSKSEKCLNCDYLIEECICDKLMESEDEDPEDENFNNINDFEDDSEGNPFNIGDVVIWISPTLKDEFTEGDKYVIIEIDNGVVLTLNDNKEKSWSIWQNFEKD